MIRKLVFVLALMFSSHLQAAPLTLTTTNHIALRGPVTDESVSQLIADLFSSQSDDLILYLDSPGGSIIAGDRLIAALKASGKKITCVANFAASMAFIILQSCDVRVITPNGVLMQHVASYGVEGNAPNNVSMLNFLERMIKLMDEAQAARLGLSLEEFKTRTRNDYWLYSGDALADRAVDRVQAVVCTSKLAKRTTKQSSAGFLGISFSKEVSACPLVNISIQSEASEIKKLNLIRVGN